MAVPLSDPKAGLRDEIVCWTGCVASEPQEWVRWIGDQDCIIAAIGLEAGPLSQRLHHGLAAAGRDVVLIETRQVKDALTAMPIKTDRRDAAVGDVHLRRALCQAATVIMCEEGQKTVQWIVFLTMRGRSTWLGTWAAQVARRHGAKRAMVALARLVAVILHRIWGADTDFRSDIPMPHAA